MTPILNPLLSAILIFASTFAYANDGAYTISGNHLIPISDSDIAVKKEILTIKRISENRATVTVYYEFLNPGKSKQLIVGFEAYSPEGDVNFRPVNGGHPYIFAFTVNMNGANIPYNIAIVTDSAYYKNGKFKTANASELAKFAEDNGYAEFFYVYHFRAPFKEGLNIIQHTYTIEFSSSVFYQYQFDYVLTAAKRWSNKQIDDFTLQIDVGSFQDLSIPATFFTNDSEWRIEGQGRSYMLESAQHFDWSGEAVEFFINKGTIIFQKKNFRPAGELHFIANRYFFLSEPFDHKIHSLPFAIGREELISDAKDELSKRILKNLPFARRGYVFKSRELQHYFEGMLWYDKDENYKAEMSSLTAAEQEWVNKW